MLAGRQHLAGFALPTLRIPSDRAGYRVLATDRTAGTPSCGNGDGADGNFKRPQACALDVLHTEVTCETTFHMHACMAS